MAKFVERVWACDTMTGAKIAPIPAQAFSYSRVMNDDGSGTMTIPVNSSQAKKIDLRTVLREIKTTLVFESDGEVVAAGIVGNKHYDRDSGMFTLNHFDLWTMMAARKAILHGIPDAMIAHLICSGNLSNIARQLLKESVAPGSQYSLPIIFGAEEGGSETRTYYGYAMQDVEAALHELMDSEGGPDIDMLPEWSPSGNLRWAPRIGDLTTGTVREWNLEARDHGLKNVTWDTDVTGITTNAYLIGEGSEKNTIYRSNPSADQSYPAMERDIAYKGVTSRNVLGKLAIEHTRTHGAPTQQWGVSVSKDGNGKAGSLRVQDLRLGDTVRIYSASDPVLPVGWSENRLIKFSGALESQFVRLEFQQIGA